MSNENRGKQFEQHIREAFLKVPNCSVDRLHDQTTGFKGSSNICDFIVYKEPYEYYLECKSCHGNTWNFGNLTDNQYKGLNEKSVIQGVYAGVLVWWVDWDVTIYFPIEYIKLLKEHGFKSLKFTNAEGIPVNGVKKRVFFDYDMKMLLEDIQSWKIDCNR